MATKSESTNPTMLTQQQLAARLAVEESTLEDWRMKGVGPAFWRESGRKLGAPGPSCFPFPGVVVVQVTEIASPRYPVPSHRSDLAPAKRTP
jgi:hypothetical protein